jgi:ribosomal protein S18 acetylase RimI-like enzyme
MITMIQIPLRSFTILSLATVSYSWGGFDPLSYKIALLENSQPHESRICRRLALGINDKFVGDVRYDISLDPDRPSFISQLHVLQCARNHKGYGKVLLYAALKDIVQSGSTIVELDRCPFDLRSGDNPQKRDKQLKKWYRSFGFKDRKYGNMRLNTRKLLNVEVVPTFSDEDITFSFRKPIPIKAALR